MEETQVVQSAAGTSDVSTAGTATEATAAAPATEEASAPTPADGTAEASATASETTEATTADEAKARNERRERQAERRKQPTPPPPKAPTPEEIIAAYERNRQEQERTERERTERFQKNARLIGEDKVKTDSGEEITRYEQLRREAFATITDPGEYGDVSPEAYAAHKAALAKRDKAVRDFNELTERRQLIENDLTPVRQQALKQAEFETLNRFGDLLEKTIGERGLDPMAIITPHLPKGVNALPAILADLATAIERPHLDRIAELEDQHAADQSEIAAWKQRAGGEAAQPIRGGVPMSGGQMTRDQFLALPKDQKDRIRRENPALMAEIYSRSA